MVDTISVETMLIHGITDEGHIRKDQSKSIAEKWMSNILALLKLR